MLKCESSFRINKEGAGKIAHQLGWTYCSSRGSEFFPSIHIAQLMRNSTSITPFLGYTMCLSSQGTHTGMSIHSHIECTYTCAYVHTHKYNYIKETVKLIYSNALLGSRVWDTFTTGKAMCTWIYIKNEILKTEEVSPSGINMVMAIQLPIVRSVKATEGRRLTFLIIKYVINLLGMSVTPRRIRFMNMFFPKIWISNKIP